MLKRLFISLIILSTLTSEGVINLHSNYYSLYMLSGKLGNYINNGEDSSEDTIKDLKVVVEDCNSFANDGTLLLSINYSMNINAGNALKKGFSEHFLPIGNYSFNKPYYNETCNKLINKTLIQSEKESILNTSDSSPPPVII